jgi:hypothetical protein
MARVRLKPLLTEDAILTWAKEYHNRTGKWPRASSGLVDGAGSRETWRAVDQALHNGGRGLPRGGSSLRLLLQHDRGDGVRSLVAELRRSGFRASGRRNKKAATGVGAWRLRKATKRVFD